MKIYEALVVDDEKLACQRMERLLQAHPAFEVIGVCQTFQETAAFLQRRKPDVLFLDIELKGKTGFEVLEFVVPETYVVFCTAYGHYALQAFETMAVDYLMKPVLPERLALTLEKIQKNGYERAEDQFKRLASELEKLRPKKIITSLPHKTGDRIQLIRLEDIVYFEANGKYVDYYDRNGGKYLSEMSLRLLEEKLPETFVRIHRGKIVNWDCVREFRKYFKGKYMLKMNDAKGSLLESGGGYSERIREKLAV
ncbi:MAG: LytTR family DNA-binding domain-containing protein [Cytophagales bacterium]|nr:LytTR family DNA-binding domain-containing protein [Cytophagales bacterium]